MSNLTSFLLLLVLWIGDMAVSWPSCPASCRYEHGTTAKLRGDERSARTRHDNERGPSVRPLVLLICQARPSRPRSALAPSLPHLRAARTQAGETTRRARKQRSPPIMSVSRCNAPTIRCAPSAYFPPRVRCPGRGLSLIFQHLGMHGGRASRCTVPA